MRSRSLGLLVATVLLAGACTGEEEPETEGPDPRPVAEALAAALAAGSLSGVPVAEDGEKDLVTYAEVVEGMGGIDPTVDLREVSAEGAEGTATLGWTWALPEEEWAYESTASLLLDGEGWQVDWDPSVVEPSLGPASVLDVTSVSARRGDILGARGLKLVTYRPVVRVGIDRSAVPKERAAESARSLARLVGIDPAPYVDQVRAAGDLAFVEAIVFRRDELPGAVAEGYDRIRGGRLVTDDIPLAPTREFAAPLLGTVGEVTAEMIEADPSLRPGDIAGLSGLQERYDEQLQGVDGTVVNRVGPDGKERELFRAGGDGGEPLRLTLDLDLQLEAELLLRDVGPASAIVAVQPSSGAILAAANGPGTGGLNIATFGQYAPGSTFKAVSTLALLRSGLDPASVVPCTTTVTVDGRRFTNYSDYPPSGIGSIPLRSALANSCNTAFIAAGQRLDDGALFDAAAALGMGIDHDLGFPAFLGQVEPAATETEGAANLIGQGRILASPMVMATVMASVQRGELVIPRLVDAIEVDPPEVDPLTAREAGDLRSMLRGVVTVGSGALLADVPGPPVLAKTGTAEFETGSGRIDTHAWMIAAQGDLAVAVFVEVGASGSRTAGPVLEEFLRRAR